MGHSCARFYIFRLQQLMYIHVHVFIGGRFTALFSNLILSVFDIQVFLALFSMIRKKQTWKSKGKLNWNTLAAGENSVWKNMSNFLNNFFLVHVVKTNLSDVINTFYRESFKIKIFSHQFWITWTILSHKLFPLKLSTDLSTSWHLFTFPWKSIVLE